MTCSGIYKALVVGAGRVGSSFSEGAVSDGVYSHAKAYQKSCRIELVGISDINAMRADAAGRYWAIQSGTDALSLCTQLRPDIISICSPDETHFPIAETILREAPPRVLFVEKPLVLRSQEAVRLLELSKEKNCAIAVNYSRRYSPAFHILKKELADGKHGFPLLLRIIYGKGLLHNGSHALDLVRFWLGDPDECSGESVTWGHEGDNTYNVDLKYANGCRVRLEAFDERIATVFELDFLAERSRWRFWLGGSQWEFSEVQPSSTYKGYYNYLPTAREKRDPLFADPMRNCLWQAVENIVAFLDGRETLLCTGEDGLAVLQLVERIRGEQ